MILGDGAVEFGVHCLTDGTVGGIALFFSFEGAQKVSFFKATCPEIKVYASTQIISITSRWFM